MNNHNVLIKSLVFLVSNLLFGVGYGQINVFAGDDGSICPGEVLEMNQLMATISGDVSDGTWLTLGDGHFLPSNSNSEVFSVAVSYIPGPGDIKNGWFTLMLASDYAQQRQSTDMVTISFQTSPTFACNSSLNVSLSEGCMQEVTPQLVLANPSVPYDRYIISLFDENNRPIDGTILTDEHIGQVITVGVNHECDPLNSCWGEIRVEDKNPPPLNCINDTIPCTASILPEDLGFPFPKSVVLNKIDDNKWIATGLDECTDAEVWFKDSPMILTCSSEYEQIIFRTWHAIDEYDNQSSCIEEIYIKRDSVESVVMPPNFDDREKNALECGSNYKTLVNGHPHPDTTGYPSVIHCLNLEATFEDVPFDKCGNGFSILREWWVIDWCTSESRNHNQVIKILDTTSPEFNCPEDITVETTAYECYSNSFLITSELSVVDCSYYSISWTIYDSLNHHLASGTGEENLVAEIPIGTHTIHYTVTDDCGNSSSCSAFIQVVDLIAPQAVCDEFTSVSIGVDGTARLYASSIDDGSYDNCEIVKQEIVKMSDACDNPMLPGEYVEFCCEEVGTEVMVAYIVTDAAGNQNTCMVVVEVEDKLPPAITCPTDITISCRYPFDLNDLSEFGKVVTNAIDRKDIIINDALNSGIVGLDGIAYDNCDITISERYTTDLECNQGTIIRTFIAMDSEGLTDSCHQIISIVDEDPFDESDIMWPDHYEEEICIDTAMSPDVSGVPTYKNEDCSQLASTYDDQLFPFAEGACMKVIRQWTVIDWCQYDHHEETGLWNYTQVLKLNNSSEPTITSMCNDSLLCLYDDECLNTDFIYEILVEDDCTSPADIKYVWRIDINNNGESEYEGYTSSISEEVPLGVHLVWIRVEDRCGNNSECSFFIEVKDCKAPTPYCIGDLTTVLMHTNEQVEIWASDFDFNSTDNCTDIGDLVFSFSPDTTVKTRLLTCEDIPNGISGIVDLEMWVTDEAGNQEFCAVQINVQDNNDNCEDQETLVMVGGRTQSAFGDIIDGVMVELKSASHEYLRTEETSDGNYLFDNVPSHYSVEITPTKTDEIDRGVSTLDIVLIQRHILGFTPFNEIESLIAADVNGSGSISGSDMVHIRKLILGIYDEFPNNTPSFKWYDASVEMNEEKINSLPANVVFSSLEDDQFNVDFIGIKMGDVDHSFSRARSNNTSNRSSFKLISETTNDESTINILSGSSGLVEGIQLDLLLYSKDPIELTSKLPEFGRGNYHQIEDRLIISWVPSEAVDFDENQVLFSLSRLGSWSDQDLNISTKNSSLNSELYMDGMPYQIQLGRSERTIEENTFEAQLLNNPVIEDAHISVTTANSGNCAIQIITVSGEVIFNRSQLLSKGSNSIQISGDQFASSGIYFVRISFENQVKTLKVIKTK